MAALLRTLWVVFVELWPVLLLAAIGAAVLWRRARPALRARQAWEGEHKLLEAEVVRLSHVHGEIEALVEAQGRLAAHEVLKPEVPRWLFWRR